MIRIDAARKRYGQRPVLDGLSLDVPDGRIVALVAPNGAGKTTCLRAVAGAVDLDGGEVVLDGTLQSSGRGRVPVAFGSETRATWPSLTPREVLAHMAALMGLPSCERGRRVDRAILAVRLGDAADRRSERASTGEARKLALASLLLDTRRNVVLDEPTNGLDIPSAEAVEGAVRGLRDAGHAILITSHDVEEIGALADTVVCMSESRVTGTLGREEIRAAREAGTLRDTLRLVQSGRAA